MARSRSRAFRTWSGEPTRAVARSRSRTIASNADSASRSAARSTKKTPSRKRSTSSAAACRPSRVFPVPPGPVRVTSRTPGCPRRDRTEASSTSLPKNSDTCSGRLLGRASTVASGGKSAGRSACANWNRRSGWVRSLSRWAPRSRSVAPGGRAPSSRSAARPETRTCPPCAAPMIRAARFTAVPYRSPARRSASPTCTPMRTRSGSGRSHSAAPSARWMARQAASPPATDAKVASIPSPVVFTTSPACASTAARRRPSWSARAPRIASGCRSQRRVLDSRSVNRSTTTRQL